ncbi:related to human band 3 anion transport protein [Phialocephala subalpina]|uniref:Related to human band 3 anion transport protein n=1 Tax=Phialocephala subalpina TaxID=576137 RepID=A0A1L7XD40_9HELO|nr:related to human band 3 anion transport protein [Phialocephala subalpina]
MASGSENSSSSRLPEKMQESPEKDITESNMDVEETLRETSTFEIEVQRHTDATYSSMQPRTKGAKRARWKKHFAPGGKLRPFRLLRQDIGNIRKRYISDWTLFNQLIFASAVYVYFTNILPGITFASDLYMLTGMTWGTIEVVFSIQPLTILGVTGPFSVLAENIYSLCIDSFHVDFLHVMAWSLIHAAWMHYLLAIFNAHDWTMQYVTTFSADIFSLLNSVIYFHKAVQELQRNHDAVSFASFLYSVIGAKPLFHRYIRMGLTEYAAAISIILFIGIPHIGELATLDKQKLQVQTSFRPSDPARTVFFVRFWELPIEWIFLSIIPGAIVTILFYFDHEISNIICTLDRYGTKKPGGFAWDIVLVGTTTAICGILGIPPANGLPPQAPLHSESLMHTIKTESISIDKKTGERKIECKETHSLSRPPFLQASGILLFISPPFQHILGLTPTSVLAGLFLFMGEQSLAVNPILFRFFYILTPPSELPPLPKGVKNYLGIHAFTLLQILMTGIIFYITLTVAAPAFPVVIIALAPVRLLVMNRVWGRETLRFVDAWACKEGTPEGDEDGRNGALSSDEGMAKEKAVGSSDGGCGGVLGEELV